MLPLVWTNEARRGAVERSQTIFDYFEMVGIQPVYTSWCTARSDTHKEVYLHVSKH